MVACLVNIGLNPLLIFGASGLPGLGFHGIAVSTILIQCGVAVWLVTRALKTTAMQDVTLSQFLPGFSLTVELIKQSAPASLNMMVMMAGGFLIQTHLQPFGAAAVAGYGIAFRVEQLILLPILAISFATMPMVAQNFGAKNYDRVRQSVTLAWSAALSLSLIGAVALALGGVAMTRIFTDDPAAIASGAAYLQLAALMMPAYSLMFIITSFFQGVRRPIWSSAVGIYRQIFALALFPALFVAYTDWGLTAVWAGLFAAVWSGFVFAFFLTFMISRQTIGGMKLDFAGVRQATA
jgi:Na+-driven multidrug efflux pump